MILTDNFRLQEFASNDGASFPKEVLSNLFELAVNLQVLRDELNAPIKINSGYRSAAHNKKIGGVSNSQHVKGTAADIVVKGFTPDEVAKAIEQLIAKGKMNQGGLGIYDSFVHYDIRGNKARWNNSKK